MHHQSRRSPLLLACLFALVLAGCETAEERAETHYQRGMELLEEGEVDRALVEFRNVFRLNGNHTEARLTYAGLLRERGELSEAYGQYLRLVEQDPESIEGRVALVELALATGNTPDARTHIDAAFGMAPEDTHVRALKAATDYAIGDNKPAALAMAREVLEADPTEIPAHMTVIADRVNAGDFEAALPLIETALEHAPEDEGLHVVRLGTLEQLGQDEAVGAQLQRMVEIFPDTPAFRQSLVQWHVGAGDTEGAEAVLRQIAAETPDDPEPKLTVVQFLFQTRGAEAARAELKRLIAESSDPVPFRRSLAVLDFSEGNQAEGIDALRRLIEDTEPSDERRDAQIVLAQMLAETGDLPGRDALVDAVLAEDVSHVEALKLRARREIAADQPELAIADMRDALEQAPRDAEALTIMAEAHQREGSRELAGERLALAVEASNGAPAEAIRYANFLLEDDRDGPAESVVVNALSRAPQNRDLLMLLGQIHLERGDWSRATDVADILRENEDPVAAQMADAIEATALRAQDRTDETVAMLRGMIEEDNQNTAAVASLVQTYVAAGDLEAARSYVEEKLAEEPDSTPLRMIRAGLHTISNEPEAAEETYRAVIADDPTYAQAYQALFGHLTGQGRVEEAEAVLDEGIAAVEEDSELLFTKAALLEGRGEFENAIAAYDELYSRNSGSLVVANNLASLLTTHRADDESLERAFTIARRLRSSDSPYFQDTYGWILHRRGDFEQALTYLRPAAAGLPDNALVQFHLGKTYAALGRRDEALSAFARAVEVADPESTLPQIAEARAELAAPSAPTEPAAPSPGQ